MQTQVQAPQNPKPQFSVPQNKLKMAVLIVLALALISFGYYFAYQYSQQTERAEQITRDFEEYLARGQYFDAYSLLKNLPNKRLGSTLQETQASLNQLFATKFAEITESILAEDEKDYRTFLQINGFQIFSNNSDAVNIVNDQVQIVLDQYLAEKLEYAQVEYYLKNVARLGFTGSFLKEAQKQVAVSEYARENTRTGQSLFADRDFLGALAQFLRVTEDDKDTYDLAQIGIKQTLAQFYTQIDQWTARGQYEQALAALDELQALMPGNKEVTRKIAIVKEAYEQEERSLVAYEGPVEHIFFRPLIAYPELAFDGSSEQKDFNEWFLTVPEFEKIIEELYAKNFILISPSELYETQLEADQEKIVPKKLRLPEGKKPLIISIDNMNYPGYMKENGIIHRLILDENKKVASYSISPDGKEIVSYDNAIVPILDAFVEKNPDFSFRGAKGIIALTGYEGILGYRTNKPEAKDFEQQKTEALKVVQVLKENGWSFASYSQGYINVREVTYDKLVRDTERWQKEVASLIGPTEIYIYPFGASLKPEDPKFKYLVQAGFKVFCSVGPKPYLQYADHYIAMDRRHINGLALYYQADLLKDLFISAEILDPVRPPLE